MGKKPYSTSGQEQKRVKAKCYLRAKVPIRKISKIVKISEKTVSRLQTRKAIRKKGSGRKKKLNKSLKTKIRNAIKANPFLTPKDFVNRLELDCSPETAQAYLVEIGLTYRTLTIKEPLSEDQQIESFLPTKLDIG